MPRLSSLRKVDFVVILSVAKDLLLGTSRKKKADSSGKTRPQNDSLGRFFHGQ
jgi:hypothetical protein